MIATPFLGVGTGRCGTNSLAKIVGACKKTNVTHELFRIPWYEATEDLGHCIRLMREDRQSGIIRGEVSCHMLPHIEGLRDPLGSLNVVCLHRDKYDFVESAEANLKELLRPGDQKRGISGQLYPVIDAVDSRQAWEFWWEFVEATMGEITPPVFHMQMADLNKDHRLIALYDFLGIPQENRVLPEIRKYGVPGIPVEDSELKTRQRMGESYWRTLQAAAVEKEKELKRVRKETAG